MTDTPESAAPAELETAGEPRVIGEFDSFDAVRAFVAEDDDEAPIMAGDLAVVKGSLVRALPSGMFASVVNLVDEFSGPADHTEQFSRALTDIEKTVLSAEFSGNSLLGTFVNVLVGMFKSRPKQWSQMSEGEQRDLKKQLEGHGKDLIRRIVRVVSEGEEISVAGKLESYTHKGSFDLKISALGDDEDSALQLFRMQGHEVLIVSADSKRYMGDSGDALIDADEPPLPFADGPGAFDEAEEEQEEEAPVTDEQLAEIADEVVEEQAAEADTDEDAGSDGTGETDEEPPVSEDNDADTAPATDGQEPGEYEGRENPDDDPLPAGAPEFTEATEDELAAQRARAQGDLMGKADWVGPTEPKAANVGESWINTSGDDERPKYLHDNGRWYLKPPEAPSEPAETPPADDTGFPDDVD